MKRFVGRLALSPEPQIHCDPAPEVHEGCHILHRGYIANFGDLVAEAERRGEKLQQMEDGALFAKAYRWWGEDIQTHVYGEYAVAMFNGDNSSLFLTHDALGLTPLFFTERQDGLHFASHLDDLICQIGASDLDEEYIADYLATARIISVRTPFVNVRRLGPGQSLRWANRRIGLRTNWSLESVQPLTLARNEEYEERFRALTGQAVSAALRTDGKAWCELSGGLDSSTVTSLAATLRTDELEAISIISTKYRTDDESKWIESVVNAYGLPWQTLDSSTSLPFSELPDGFFAEPISVTPVAGLLRRYKALAEARDVRVVLTGVGGDSVLCGDAPKPYYLADYFPFHILRLLRSLREWRDGSDKKRSWTHMTLETVAYPLLRHMIGKNMLPGARGGAPVWSDKDYLRARNLRSRGAISLASGCRSVGAHYHAERILCHVFNAGNFFDRGSCSFEFRNPLLYLPLVEFMFSIPWEQKIQPGQDRYLQRRALKGILPEPIRRRRTKGGSDQTFAEGLRKGNAWTELLLINPRIVERGYVDAKLWAEAVNRARYGVRSSMKDFVAAATLEIWLRQLEAFRRNTRRLDEGRWRRNISVIGKVP